MHSSGDATAPQIRRQPWRCQFARCYHAQVKPLYLAADPLEAEILKDYLAGHGIAVQVFGGLAWGGRGDLPTDIYPRLHTVNPMDEPRARALLRDYERRRHAHAEWLCRCGESSPVTFDACWSCQSERPA